MDKVNNSSSLKQTLYAASGSIAYAFAQLAIVILIGHKNGAEELGLYSLSLSITAPVFMFLTGGVRQYIGTDANSEIKYISPIVTRFVSIFLCTAISLVISLFFNEAGLFNIILATCFMKSIEVISEVHYGFFQRHDKNNYTSYSMTLRGIAIVICFLSFLNYSIEIALYCTGLIWFVIVIFEIFMIKKLFFVNGVNILIKNSMIKDAFEFTGKTWLCGFNNFQVSLLANTPRFFIAKIADTNVLALYSSATYIIAIGNIVVNALSQGFGKKIALFYDAEEKKSARKIIIFVSSFMIICSIIGCIVLFFWGEVIFEAVFGFSFENYNKLLVLMGVAALFHLTASFISNSLIAIRDIKGPAKITSAVTVVVIISCFVSSSLFGFYGVVMAVVLCYFLQFFLNSFRAYRKLK